MKATHRPENIGLRDEPANDVGSAIAPLALKCLDGKGVRCGAWEKVIDDLMPAL